MRNIPSQILELLNKRVQTRGGSSDPSTRMWISRPSTALVNDIFLERQTVATGSVDDVSVAVCHPRAMRGNTQICIGYISEGIARVATAKHKSDMSAHEWFDVDFEEAATAISVAYDGTMPKANNGYVEFETEPYPWVFWVNDSVLYGRKLYSDEDSVILAETNCTDVSAVRAMHSSVGGFDFGLVIFFILNGQLFYRQLIDGEWQDAETVGFGPSGMTWKEVSAFRTWDYRIGVQAKSTNGDIYELFTQYMGIGKQNVEHIQVDVEPKAKYIPIDYTDVRADEHVESTVSVHGTRIYGLSSKPIVVHNVDDGTGNYGTTILVELDYPVTNVEGNSANFFLVDGNTNAYTCTDCRVSDDGKTLILTFVDFNLAEGTTLTIDYIPGTIQSPATAMDAFTFSFAPTNLVAPDIPVPEPVEAWNLDSEGTEVALRFSQSLVGDITGNETKITVTGQTYEYVPNGELESASRTVTAVSNDSDDDTVIYLKFADGNTKSIKNMVGTVAIAYSGGTLKGLGGPVADFIFEFLPTDLAPKHHPNVSEHVEAEVDVNADLIKVYYTDTSEPEHIEAVVTPIGNLIHVDDI